MRKIALILLFHAILTGVSFAIAPSLSAQSPLVAIILPKDIDRYQILHKAFLAEFTKQEFSNFRVYVQTPNYDLMSLRNSARKAVAIDADIIIAYGSLAAVASRTESLNTPILFADVFEPVIQGVLREKDKPSRKMTGLTGNGPPQTLLKFFREATQGDNLAVLYAAGDQCGESQARFISDVARYQKFKLSTFALDCRGDIETQLQQLPADIDGVYLADDVVMRSKADEIIGYTLKRGIPVISQYPGLTERGAFMVFESDLEEQGRKLAEYLKKVLAGADVQFLEPALPRKIGLVINMKVAGDLDIHVPFDILAETSRIVR